jgi:hypothetical protein
MAYGWCVLFSGLGLWFAFSTTYGFSEVWGACKILVLLFGVCYVFGLRRLPWILLAALGAKFIAGTWLTAGALHLVGSAILVLLAGAWTLTAAALPSRQASRTRTKQPVC